jgi:CubicO group peptidase (beta-lactamase class C family)
MTHGADDDHAVMRGFPVPMEARVRLTEVYRPRSTRWFMQHVREVAPTAHVSRGAGRVHGLPEDLLDLDHTPVRGGDGRSWALADMLEGTWADAAIVLHRGRVVYERYFGGMTPETPHLYQSVSKSLGACLAGCLIEQGLLSMETPVTEVVPELAGSGYGGATVRDLLDMRVGIRYVEDYTDEDGVYMRLERLYGFRPSRADDEPGSSYEHAVETRREGRHGGPLRYVSLNLQVLAWMLERVTNVRLPELIGREIWSALGTEHDAYIALDGAGSAQLEGGFCSSLRDFARFGLMICRGGRSPARPIVPEWFIEDAELNGDREAYDLAASPDDSHVIPSPAYRNNFWTAAPAGGPVLMGLGIFGQFLYVDRAAEFVMAVFSTQPTPSEEALRDHRFGAARSLVETLRGSSRPSTPPGGTAGSRT